MGGDNSSLRHPPPLALGAMPKRGSKQGERKKKGNAAYGMDATSHNVARLVALDRRGFLREPDERRAQATMAATTEHARAMAEADDIWNDTLDGAERLENFGSRNPFGRRGDKYWANEGLPSNATHTKQTKNKKKKKRPPEFVWEASLVNIGLLQQQLATQYHLRFIGDTPGPDPLFTPPPLYMHACVEGIPQLEHPLRPQDVSVYTVSSVSTTTASGLHCPPPDDAWLYKAHPWGGSPGSEGVRIAYLAAFRTGYMAWADAEKYCGIPYANIREALRLAVTANSMCILNTPPSIIHGASADVVIAALAAMPDPLVDYTCGPRTLDGGQSVVSLPMLDTMAFALSSASECQKDSSELTETAASLGKDSIG